MMISLEQEMTKHNFFQDFIGKCLIEDPVLRPDVVKLMFHKWLFEVCDEGMVVLKMT